MDELDIPWIKEEEESEFDEEEQRKLLEELECLVRQQR